MKLTRRQLRRLIETSMNGYYLNEQQPAVGPDGNTPPEQSEPSPEQNSNKSPSGKAYKLKPPMSLNSGTSVTHVINVGGKKYALKSNGDIIDTANISGWSDVYWAYPDAFGGLSLSPDTSIIKVPSDKKDRYYTEQDDNTDEDYSYVHARSDYDIVVYTSTGDDRLLFDDIKDIQDLIYWRENLEIIKTGTEIDKDSLPGQTQEDLPAEADPTPKKKSPGGSSSSKSTKIKYIQGVIGDKVDGKWTKNTDAKWKEWIDADNHKNLQVIIQLGLSKGDGMSPDKATKAAANNNAGALAVTAGFANTLTGVYNMVKAVEAYSPEDKKAAAVIASASEIGQSVAAAKGIDPDEQLTPEFDEQMAIDMGIKTSKVKDKKQRRKIVQNISQKFEALKEKASSPQEKADLDRKFRLFKKKTGLEKSGYDDNTEEPPEDLKESLSRGALYRRRYYGRY